MWKINSSFRSAKSQVSSTTLGPYVSLWASTNLVVCQFWIGVELAGSANPATDIWNHRYGAHFLKIGIQGVKPHLNTLGNPWGRAAYRQALIDYLTPLKETLSRIANVVLEILSRVLDSKEKTRWQ